MELFTRLRDSFSSAMSGASSGTEDAGDGAYNADRDEHPQSGLAALPRLGYSSSRATAGGGVECRAFV